VTGTPVQFRFTTRDRAIAESLADQYGGDVAEDAEGGFEVIATTTEELPGDACEVLPS
jgi:hypothetical protein